MLTEKFDMFVYKYLEHIMLEQTDPKSIQKALGLTQTKYGLAYHPPFNPSKDPEEMKRTMIRYNRSKWADDKGKFTKSTKDTADELMGMGKSGHVILGHETIHALQKKHASHLLKGSTKLGDDITKDKVAYLSLPSEIMAFAYTYVQGDKKYYPLYKKIGGPVFKLYLRYIDKYQKMKQRGQI
jgi:hypothetical protein